MHIASRQPRARTTAPGNVHATAIVSGEHADAGEHLADGLPAAEREADQVAKRHDQRGSAAIGTGRMTAEILGESAAAPVMRSVSHITPASIDSSRTQVDHRRRPRAADAGARRRSM